ncbi:MAG: hypothetical protein LBI92_03785 [Azoarcus sp.]|jgi:hypothetical protein|nr:hypothetical protein [Azoarcus sp.]
MKPYTVFGIAMLAVFVMCQINGSSFMGTLGNVALRVLDVASDLESGYSGSSGGGFHK